MSELYGFQAGQRLRQQDDQARQLNQLAMQKGAQDIEAGKIALESSELALTAQKKMIDLLNHRDTATADRQSGAPPLGGEAETSTIPDGLDDLAAMAMASGMPQQAAEYASKASTIRNQASEIATRATDSRIKELKLIGNLLDNVHDQTSFDQANALYSMTTGHKSPFAGQRYNPGLIDRVRGAMENEKDKALTAAAKARTNASIAATKEREARVALIRAQTSLTQTRDTALNKAGAVGKQPKAEDLRAVSDLINSEYMGSVTPEDARILARPIAERMNDLMASQNLTRSQAATRAFLEAQASGDFGGLRKRNQMPGTKTKPLEMPESKEKLKPNMYYRGKGKYEGQLLLWNGKGFTVAQPGQGNGNVTAREEADDTADAVAEGEDAGETVDNEGFPVYDNEHTDTIED